MDMENGRLRPELPDVIIQHIQSFLRPNAAAQTMLVSKSWLRAWSTRPFLYFNFINSWPNSEKRYDDVVDCTLKSYVDRGLNIMKFHLDIGFIKERWLKMLRRSNVIELHINADRNWTDSLFEEIFLTESLQVLSIASSPRFVSRPRFVLSHLDIKCLNLRKLEFLNMEIGEGVFTHVMSSCPLLDELQFLNCTFEDFFETSNFGIQPFMFGVECASLKRLTLHETKINDEQLHTILSKSPLLEDFNLIHSDYKLVKPIILSSISLKRVNLDNSNAEFVVVDAPNLHKLKFSSRQTRFPITLTRPITKGIVKVTINYRDEYIDEAWLHWLKKFLSKFAKSNVKLTSYYGYPLRTNFMFLRATPLHPRHEVDTLRFKGFNNRPLLYAFFTICHPKTVLLDFMSKRKHLFELLKDISYRGNLECCSFDRNKCWRHYIKDGILYYLVGNEKKPLDMNGLETELGNKEMITLAIEWESSY